MQRHRHERIGKRCLVEVNRFEAVGQEHRNAVAARKAKPRKGMAPAFDLQADRAEGIVLPCLFLGVPSFIGRVVGPFLQVVREKLWQGGEHIERFNAFASAVLKIFGHEELVLNMGRALAGSGIL